MVNYWIIPPYYSGKPAVFDRVWQYDRDHGTIAMGWERLGSEIKELARLDRKILRERITDYYPARHVITRGIDATEIKRLYQEIQIGDTILARRGCGEMLAEGRVTKTACYDQGKGEARAGAGNEVYPNFLKVEWTMNGKRFVKRNSFSQNTIVKKTEPDYRRILDSPTL